jgi:hypothetical protein
MWGTKASGFVDARIPCQAPGDPGVGRRTYVPIGIHWAGITIWDSGSYVLSCPIGGSETTQASSGSSAGCLRFRGRIGSTTPTKVRVAISSRSRRPPRQGALSQREDRS